MPHGDDKPPLKERLKELFLEYGKVALGVYLVLFAIVFTGFLVAIIAGFDTTESTGKTMGTLAAAWVATKVTQPIRIGVTLLLTPLVGQLLRSRRAGEEQGDDADEDDGDADDEEE